MIKSVYTDRVFIERIKPEESGYILPEDSSEEEIFAGTVMYIAENVKNTAVGDVVVFDPYDYKQMIIEGVHYIIAKEDTLICKIEKNESN
jgi:co-chaperonin GroES (HSP10)